MRSLSLARRGSSGRVCSDQIVEQSAVMDHRLAKILGTRLPSLMANGDVVRLVVVLDDHGMIDGDVAGALVEIAHRITARLHDVAEERVGKGDRARRIVHETRLDIVPAMDELAALVRIERPDVELFDPLLAFGELRLA